MCVRDLNIVHYNSYSYQRNNQSGEEEEEEEERDSRKIDREEWTSMKMLLLSVPVSD